MSKLISISEAAHIAIHGMILVAKADGVMNVQKISEAMDSSKHHVAKVFQRLVKAGFVASQRGPNGGFKLLKKPGEITMLDIYQEIEGEISVSECPLEKPVCPFSRCIMNGITKKLTLEFKKYMQEQTLEDFLDY